MPARDIYERTFDEDDTESADPSDYPDCGGPVHTTGIETTCGDCGLVIEAGRVKLIVNSEAW